MTILDTIIDYKKDEVSASKRKVELAELKDKQLYGRICVSLSENIKSGNNSGIIAEFKRKSPSIPNIALEANVSDIVPYYEEAGASACSILTDTHFFGGSLADLEKARSLVDISLLRKDFTISPYQLHEAKAFGADLILLIANALTPNQVEEFAHESREIGLEVLLEIDKEEHLEKHLNKHVNLVGVNNRDLKTFKTDIANSQRLGKLIPNEFLKISESGISNPEAINSLKKDGFNGFLIGQCFMEKENPGKSCIEFMKGLD